MYTIYERLREALFLHLEGQSRPQYTTAIDGSVAPLQTCAFRTTVEESWDFPSTSAATSNGHLMINTQTSKEYYHNHKLRDRRAGDHTLHCSAT